MAHYFYRIHLLKEEFQCDVSLVFHSLCIKSIKTKEAADWSMPDFENLSCWTTCYNDIRLLVMLFLTVVMLLFFLPNIYIVIDCVKLSNKIN